MDIESPNATYCRNASVMFFLDRVQPSLAHLLPPGRGMMLIGYHASHEQFTPSSLLRCAAAAEAAGFTAGSCSDHFHPWLPEQGQSGFAWAWLGAALEATSLPFGVVTAPGYRYHPAILAQAAGTLAEMYPGRFWLAPGSGEALNEQVTGARWPVKTERNALLRECVEVMRALWSGETVTHRGLVTVEEATLYTRPETPPPVIGPALTSATAEWLGGWADGLITTNKPDGEHREVVEAFRRGGGEGKPVYLQVKVCYAADEAQAMAQAHEQWRANIFESSVLATLRSPAEFQAAAKYVRPEDVARSVRVSADAGRHLEWLREDMALRPAGIFLHNVGREQEAFIDFFGARVLPELEIG